MAESGGCWCGAEDICPHDESPLSEAELSVLVGDLRSDWRVLRLVAEIRAWREREAGRDRDAPDRERVAAVLDAVGRMVQKLPCLCGAPHEAECHQMRDVPPGDYLEVVTLPARGEAE